MVSPQSGNTRGGPPSTPSDPSGLDPLAEYVFP